MNQIPRVGVCRHLVKGNGPHTDVNGERKSSVLHKQSSNSSEIKWSRTTDHAMKDPFWHSMFLDLTISIGTFIFIQYYVPNAASGTNNKWLMLKL